MATNPLKRKYPTEEKRLQVAPLWAIKTMRGAVLVTYLVKLFKMLVLNGPKNYVKQIVMGMDNQMVLN